MNNANQHVAINTGVDYERALEVLSGNAGRSFRKYLAAKKDGESVEVVADLKEHYRQAQKDVELLNRHDHVRIQQILSEGRV